MPLDPTSPRGKRVARDLTLLLDQVEDRLRTQAANTAA